MTLFSSFRMILALLAFFTTGICQISDQQPGVIRQTPAGHLAGYDAQMVTHALWDTLLKTHVQSDGRVDYRGFLQDTARLNGYLRILQDHHPDETTWTREAQMAYWINAYNAFTLKLVLDHYPVESIRDIRRGIPFVNSVWDIGFIKIEGQTYDLNNLEHGILRPKFKDARIHFAINCASISCPDLRAEAYTAKRLEGQLESQARLFLNNPAKNVLDTDRVRISRIFSWFRGDFTRAGTLIDFLNKYSAIPIRSTARIRYMDYNWSLNDVAGE